MEKTRYEKGLENLCMVDGEGGRQVIISLADIAPDVGRYITEFAFGDIYSRPGLTLRERELVTVVSLLTAGGCEKQLSVHIAAALNAGASPKEVTEAFIQCIPYTGFPRVLNALFTAKEVFRERGITL